VGTTAHRSLLCIGELLPNALPPSGLFFEQVEVVSPHAVHDEEGHSDVPAGEQEAVPPYLSPDCPRLHLRLVLLGYPLPRDQLLWIGKWSVREVSLLDDLALEVAVSRLLLGRKDESGVETPKRPFEGLRQLIHN
jgi:hypothetical protein